MCQNLFLGEKWKDIFYKLLGIGGEIPRGTNGAATDGPQTALRERWVQLICVFLQEAWKLGARADPQGKLETKLSLNTSGPSPTPFPHRLLSLLSK